MNTYYANGIRLPQNPAIRVMSSSSTDKTFSVRIEKKETGESQTLTITAENERKAYNKTCALTTLRFMGEEMIVSINGKIYQP